MLRISAVILNGNYQRKVGRGEAEVSDSLEHALKRHLSGKGVAVTHDRPSPLTIPRINLCVSV